MKRVVVYVIYILCSVMFLTACTGKREEALKRYADNQLGFIQSTGNHFVETPEGYYVLMGHYLAYMDKEMKDYTLLCSKPECLHNKERDEEQKVNCNAFYANAKAIQYHEGKLYVLADALTFGPSQQSQMAVYEVLPDGESKKKIYTGGEYLQSMLAYENDLLVYEKKFISDEPNPVLTVTRFPISNPEKGQVIFESKEYRRSEINYFSIYQDFCYFEVVEFGALEEKGLEIISHIKRIDLKNNEIKEYGDYANNGINIVSDWILCHKINKYSLDTFTWEKEYYKASLDGEKVETFDTTRFAALRDNTTIIMADDKYVYIPDLYYGDYDIKKEDQVIHVYSYEGEEKASISIAKISEAMDCIVGNEKILLISDQLEDGGYVYYKVDKEKLKNGGVIEPEEILRMPLEEFWGSYTY